MTRLFSVYVFKNLLVVEPTKNQQIGLVLVAAASEKLRVFNAETDKAILRTRYL